MENRYAVRAGRELLCKQTSKAQDWYVLFVLLLISKMNSSRDAPENFFVLMILRKASLKVHAFTNKWEAGNKSD